MSEPRRNPGALECLALLRAAFPQATVSEETKRAYLAGLSDVPAPVLRQAVERAVRTCRFFPSIAELREIAASLAGVLPPSPEDALGLAKAAGRVDAVRDRAGDLRWHDRYWDWPHGVSAAVRQAATAAGHPFDDEGVPVFGWDQRYLGAYRAVATAIRHARLSDFAAAAREVAEERRLDEPSLSPWFGEPGVLPCGFIETPDTIPIVATAVGPRRSVVVGREPSGERHDPACPTCALWSHHYALGTPFAAQALAATRRRALAPGEPGPAGAEENRAKVRELLASLSAKTAVPAALSSEAP